MIDVAGQVAWLAAEVGFREGPNNSNPYGPWQGVRNAAYCNSFADEGAYVGGGYRFPTWSQFGEKGTAYVPYAEDMARKLGIWRSGRGPTNPPRRGWRPVFDWTGWGGGDHIGGAVLDSDDGWRTFWTVEGNTGSPQGVHYVRRDWAYVRGFIALDETEGGGDVPAGPRELKLGFEGDDVTWLQSRLTELGYHVPGGIDGDFGEGTWQAVLNFQNDWVPAERGGIVGLVTREAMADDAHRADMQPPKPPPPSEPSFPAWPGRYMRRGHVGEDVYTLQARLAERGWVDSSGRRLKADRWFGRETDRVFRLFQAYAGLEDDGVAGPVAWNALWTVPVT